MSGSLSVRVARPDDLGDLLEIEESCFKEPNPRLLTRVCGLFDLLYVADFGGKVSEGEVVGYVLSAPESSEKTRVVSLAVHPEYRRKGVATSLMTESLYELSERGFSTVFLEVRVSNEGAFSLYRRLGFREVGVKKGYYDDGENAYYMKKEL